MQSDFTSGTEIRLGQNLRSSAMKSTGHPVPPHFSQLRSVLKPSDSEYPGTRVPRYPGSTSSTSSTSCDRLCTCAEREGALEPGKNLNKAQLECFRLVCDRVGKIDYRTGCFRYEMSSELQALAKKDPVSVDECIAALKQVEAIGM
eukprot:335038-Rhodomonas_salina.1